MTDDRPRRAKEAERLNAKQRDDIARWERFQREVAEAQDRAEGDDTTK